MGNYMTIRTVLFSFRAALETVRRAGVARWRTTYYPPFVYRRDEDTHCAEHAKIHIIPIPNILHIKQAVSIGIAARQKKCLNAVTAAASLVPCHMAATIETIVRSASTHAMWIPVKAIV